MRRLSLSVCAVLCVAVLHFVPATIGLGRIEIDLSHPIAGATRVATLADAARLLDFTPHALDPARPVVVEVTHPRQTVRGIALVYALPRGGSVIVHEALAPKVRPDWAGYVDADRRFGVSFMTRIDGDDALATHIPYGGVRFEWIHDGVLFILDAPEATDMQARAIAEAL